MSKPGRSYAKPLSLLLSDVFKDAYAKQGFAARELVTRWGEIAGRDVAAHSEPLKLQWPRPVEGQPQESASQWQTEGRRRQLDRMEHGDPPVTVQGATIVNVWEVLNGLENFTTYHGTNLDPYHEAGEEKQITMAPLGLQVLGNASFDDLLALIDQYEGRL